MSRVTANGFSLRLGSGWIPSALSWVMAVCGAAAQEPAISTRGREVVVVYNTVFPGSKGVADHYAHRRGVPPSQVLGLRLPHAETITRAEFTSALKEPLVAALDAAAVDWRFSPEGSGPGDEKTAQRNRVRYLVLCHGVPLRIAEDPALVESGVRETRPQLKNNRAAVDSDLALLPMEQRAYPVSGALTNPLYGVDVPDRITSQNGLLMVGRLDGPSADIARGLVDKAILAEADGLWGRAYFDLRSITNQAFVLGDQWIAGAARISEVAGYETIIDRSAGTFPAATPMSQVAFYAGWYAGQACGPFSGDRVEFMPGAFAYHLHSFSAATVRSRTSHWVGPLLAQGATASLGHVYEPFLALTPNIAMLYKRFIIDGFSLGEAALAAQPVVSWQTVLVGDPLFAPFARPPGQRLGWRQQQLHERLITEESALLEWSVLQVANLNLVQGFPVTDVVRYLRSQPVTAESAVLEEKLGSLLEDQGKLGPAIEAYERALKHARSPQQRIRVSLALADLKAVYSQEREALALLEQLHREHPDYPDPLGIYRRMITLAKGLGDRETSDRWQLEVDRLEGLSVE